MGLGDGAGDGLGVGDGLGDGDGVGEGDGSGGVVPVDGGAGVGSVDDRLLQAPPITKTAIAAAVSDSLDSTISVEANRGPVAYHGPMADSISRRHALLTLSGGFLAMSSTLVAQTRGQAKPSPGREQLTIYKDKNCGCCGEWVKHMEANGFICNVNNVDMGPIKAKYGIPPQLGSCHTTLVRNYIIEGHVPAADVKKLLAASPKDIYGLTIPGMPASAPGMDSKPFQPYEVLSFDRQGKTTVYAKHVKGNPA